MYSLTRRSLKPSRRPLDTAEGILIALRHCTAEEAFREIIAASQRNGIPLFTLAAGLIDTVVGEADGTNPAVLEAVRDEWGRLLNQ